jgi:hypothetical protein
MVQALDDNYHFVYCDFDEKSILVVVEVKAVDALNKLVMCVRILAKAKEQQRWACELVFLDGPNSMTGVRSEAKAS